MRPWKSTARGPPADPDGIRLEINHVPGKGLLADAK